MQQRQKCLLLTFDSFSTLFTPREPIATQYLRAANAFGILKNFKAADLELPLREALKAESRIRPNYGRNEAGFGGPRQWWANVIESCFVKAAASRGEALSLPPGLVTELLDVFSDQRGYRLYDDVKPFFWELRRNHQHRDNVVVGVVTNSDDRVPGILKSLGLRVGRLRATDSASPHSFEVQESTGELDAPNDIDFVITSYDTGHEKPAREIYDLARQRGISIRPSIDATDWILLHIGDDFAKDYEGATLAGWESFLLSRGDEGPWNRSSPGEAPKISSLTELIPKICT